MGSYRKQDKGRRFEMKQTGHVSTIFSSRGDRLPDQLERDLRLLAAMLRRAVQEQYGPETWQLIRTLADLAFEHESGNPEADAQLSARLAGLPTKELEILMAVFGHYFDIANIAEDLQRLRILHERRTKGILVDALERRLSNLQQSCEAKALQAIVSKVEAEFVFTAHPTEARRQTVRRILSRIRQAMRKLDRYRYDREHRGGLLRELKDELSLLVRTDPLHAHRPEVLEELQRALAVSDSLWRSLPALARKLSPHGSIGPIRFGCWIGGDRDGHPFVTAEVSREAFNRLKERCLSLHRRELRELYERMSVLSCPEASDCLREVIARAHRQVSTEVRRIHPDELYRQALRTVELRLDSYQSATELLADLHEIERAAEHDQLPAGIRRAIANWRFRTEAFGLHLMRLDLRENSVSFRRLVRELLTHVGQDPEKEAANDFTGLWGLPVAFPGWTRLEAALGAREYDLLTGIVLSLEQSAAAADSVGPCVISMTHSAADVLWVLWLQQSLRRWLHISCGPGITPLFETVDDLRDSARILTELFEHPVYRQHLAQHQDRQVVMVGYSDSAKDGGYVAACWALYQGQQSMEQAAAAAGIELTCFHGRGGALGRGGGPAARAIEALPPTPGQARIRMTEQGEVIADRFVEADLAQRHMEQILGGLIAHAATGTSPQKAWQAFMNQFATASREAYLSLYHHPGFYQYFRQATPAAYIEQLPIGSRPSRRSGAGSLEDLRAIPYTFSWTQSRQLLNAFYGLGTAWQSCSDSDQQLARSMYQGWSFFRSMIDNAELALIKCDARILTAYSELMEDQAAAAGIAAQIAAEVEAATQAVLEITGQSDLMANTPWLRQSVDRRKPYLDVLNFVQIALMERQTASPDQDLTRSLRLSIQSLAAGMRSTG